MKRKQDKETKRNTIVSAMVKRHPRGGKMRHRCDRRPQDARQVARNFDA
jgi:hypothetical protein